MKYHLCNVFIVNILCNLAIFTLLKDVYAFTLSFSSTNPLMRCHNKKELHTLHLEIYDHDEDYFVHLIPTSQRSLLTPWALSLHEKKRNRTNTDANPMRIL